jgi:ferric-chelate reductase
MMFMVFGITITSLPYFRRRLFEVFYYLHVMFVFGVVCGALSHTGILVPMLVLCTWGVDVFLRSIVMARTLYPQKAKLRILSDTVVELSFPKIRGFDYNPGQYIYVALPELSFLEWHPFSLSSAPKMKTVTLHIRRAGDWTNALYELAKKKSEVSIMMEGPYGSLGVDLVGDRYKMVMLVSGGIGGESRYMQ